MSVTDRLHEKAERRRAIVVACRKRASNELASALDENARLLDLLADCYEVMLDKPRVSDEFISSTLARIEEVSQ